LLLYLLYIIADIAMVYFYYLVIRDKFSLYERNIGLLFSYLYRVTNCAKIQEGIFVLDMPISEGRFCLKI
jgi:hypothetical protein